MGFEEPKSFEETLTPDEASSERGRGFLARTGAALKEGTKMFFSLPDKEGLNSRILNVMEKAGGTAYMAIMAKVALDQRFNDLVSGDRKKMAAAALAIGLTGAIPVMLALNNQYEEKTWKERKRT